MIDTVAQAEAHENIRVGCVDTAVARWVEPCYDALPERGRLQATEDALAAGFGDEATSANTTCVELDELRVKSLDAADATNADVTELALGTDDTTAPAHSNRSLNNEVARTGLTESINNGTTLTAKFFLDTDEANGYDLVELGVYAGTHFLNHSTFASVSKTSSKSITFQVDLTFDTA